MKRLIFPALIGLALYYALFGGEYSVFEVRRAKVARAAEARELADLRQRIDSLRLRAESLETDSAVLERLAREEWGMIRDGEVLYRLFEAPDTAVVEPEGAAAR